MRTQRSSQSDETGGRPSFDWPPPDPLTAFPARRPATVGRRTHLIGAGAAGLVVLFGLGAAFVVGNSSGSGSTSLAGATHRLSPTPSSTPASAPSTPPVAEPTPTDSPHPTTSNFDAASPLPYDNPNLPTDVQNVLQGDCLRDAIRPTAKVARVVIVDCAKPHASEVYATFDLTGAGYPGRDSVVRQAERGCNSRFRAFDGTSAGSSNLDISYLFPTSESWSAADRTVRCMVGEPYGKTRSGTLRNSGR